MKKSRLFNHLLSKLEKKLELLPDKPEESYEATLMSLWLKAQGEITSVEKATKNKLTKLDSKAEKQLNKLVEKRLNGVPLAHLTGRQQFMGIDLITNSNALIPRKETEILGNFALEFLEGIPESTSEPTIVFDICCGAGNLAIAISKLNPNSNTLIYASDLSKEAISLTKENINFYNLEHKIKAFTGDLFEPFEKKEFYNSIDLIVCNPPYISDFTVNKMAKEIADFEPKMAFQGGGILGLNVIKNLINNSSKFLKEGGMLIFEIGLGQGDYIVNMCKKSGLYKNVDIKTDSKNQIRVVGVSK